MNSKHFKATYMHTLKSYRLPLSPLYHHQKPSPFQLAIVEIVTAAATAATAVAAYSASTSDRSQGCLWY